MKFNFMNRMLVAAVIIAVSLVGMSIPTNAHQQPEHAQKQKQKGQVQRKQKKQKQVQTQAQQLNQDRPPGWDKGKKVGWGNGNVPPGKQARLSEQRRQQLIAEQQRLAQYRQYLDRRQLLADQRTAQLQQQKRLAQYRYQQQYFEQMRQQQLRLASEQHNYNSDPYYYTAPSYRYTRAGSNYETNQYGADQLKQALNNGYEQGFRAGQADQQDRWNANYQSSYAYQDANYGYSGYYVSQADYSHYFREGFRRGYEDGYNTRSQYGTQANGSYSMLGTILSQILNLQSLQ